jgi:hypothetical protein|tara:strand:- start:838 stop:1059 length:222 start_codon:yes stop_codon:yes gene_type:complete
VSTKESVLFTHFATTLTLLGLGLSYKEIKELDHTEAMMFLATHQSFEEYKKEQMERNARHQEAAQSHPKFSKG